MASVPVARTLPDLRSRVAAWRKAGETVALVPTMGALHEGHLQLVKLARQRATRCVVSIFVNPTQFAPHEDFTRYPRDEAADLAKLALVNCDLVWAPDVAEMYGPGFATRVVPGGAAEGLETDFRPHFFAGVATVCCKLFTQVAPDVAIFGEKDYQQLCVVRQMVRDLNLPLEIVAGATVREPDGLAMSSRNRYLTPQERASAPALHRAILGIAGAKAEERPAVIAEARRTLEAAGFKVDYIEVRDAETLAPCEPSSSRALRVLGAAWLGSTRLIDNVAVVSQP
ncbi:MAG TPA: pantoate--beta-alanine ligase [Hyphomicrobiaceae bacterium]|nr:pantoate--beta-alanine ligase [Hyphomicrobiaceae bacterium]